MDLLSPPSSLAPDPSTSSACPAVQNHFLSADTSHFNHSTYNMCVQTGVYACGHMWVVFRTVCQHPPLPPVKHILILQPPPSPLVAMCADFTDVHRCNYISCKTIFIRSEHAKTREIDWLVFARTERKKSWVSSFKFKHWYRIISAKC